MPPVCYDVGADEEEWSSDDENEYMLGFAEEADSPTSLLRHQFPSKLGGRPAWLDPLNLPSAEQLTCAATGKPLNFLLQIYAPLDDEATHEGAFHRSLFLFTTPQGSKITQKGAVRAFRCQLPRRNDYYSYEPPHPNEKAPQALPASHVTHSLERDPWRVLESETAISNTGTASGPAAAAAAQLSGMSLAAGGAASSGKGSGAGSGGAATHTRASGKHPLVLFPEHELVVEPEDMGADKDSGNVQQLLSQYESQVQTEGELTEDELPAEVLNEVEEGESLERKHFAMFQARVASAPDQVLRYCFRPGAKPIWPSPAHQPAPSDIPHCPHCKSPRRFEFQVMPQLLSKLDQDELSGNALDWSTLIVYSCPKSCKEGMAAARQQGSAYVEEFVWVQPAV